MGDETSQFANRFAAAARLLAEFAQVRPPARKKGRSAAAARAAALGEALDAVEAVYQSGTGALRNWASQRRQVLAQVAALREALAAGAGEEAPRLARDLLHLIEARPAGR